MGLRGDGGKFYTHCVQLFGSCAERDGMSGKNCCKNWMSGTRESHSNFCQG